MIEPEVVRRLGGGGGDPTKPVQRSLFANPREQQAAKITLEVIEREFERLPRSADLANPEIQPQIIARVRAELTPTPGLLPGAVDTVDVASVVSKAIALRNELSIDIPRILLQPVGDVSRGYREFTLDLARVRLQPVENEILIQELHGRAQHRLMSGTGVVEEARIENYVVGGLTDFDDVSYDSHTELLYALAGQVVAHLRSYLANDVEVKNVLQYHQQALVNLVHVQMQAHFDDKSTTYEATVSKGFTTLRPKTCTAAADATERDFRAPITDKHDIKKMLFGGFAKCLYPTVKFDSDSERRFAVVLENDTEVRKWFRPSKNDLRIHYESDASYEPDFVVETDTEKLICEVKAAVDMEAPDVLKKRDAAVAWCAHATAHAREHGGKVWRYLLVPHDAIADNKTVSGLLASYGHGQRDGVPTAGVAAWTPSLIEPREADKFVTCVPVYDLRAAAGGFSNLQAVEPSGWAQLPVGRKARLGLFVARVVGKSMEPTIVDGSWCVFSHPVAGTRQDRILLVQHRGLVDPETSARFTVKRWSSDKRTEATGEWKHTEVRLLSDNGAFSPIIIQNTAEDELTVVAEMVDVLGRNS